MANTVITVNFTQASSSTNITHTLTVTDAVAGSILSAYGARFGGTAPQIIASFCTMLFNQLLADALNYQTQQAVQAVVPGTIASTIT